MTRSMNPTLRIVDIGGRMIPVGHLRIGEQVIAYNPHLYPISRESGFGELGPAEETPIRITTYYLGCFQRGALYALKPPSEMESTPIPSEAKSPLLLKVEAKTIRRKKEEPNRGDEPPGSLIQLSTHKETP